MIREITKELIIYNEYKFLKRLITIITKLKMGLITKSDLHYKDYSWTALKGDDPKISGEPDSTLLSRKEGYEILYFINKFSEIHNFKNKESAIKVEKIVRNEVPDDKRSQLNIKEWIEENWKDSKY